MGKPSGFLAERVFLLVHTGFVGGPFRSKGGFWCKRRGGLLVCFGVFFGICPGVCWYKTGVFWYKRGGGGVYSPGGTRKEIPRNGFGRK